MPGPQTVLAAGLCFVFLCLLRPRLPWASARAGHRPEPWAVRAVLCGYFAALAFMGHSFSPERQVSTGVHQQFGDCHATDVDLLGYERKRGDQRRELTWLAKGATSAGSASRRPTSAWIARRHLTCLRACLREAPGRISPEDSITGRPRVRETGSSPGGVATWYTVCGAGPATAAWRTALLALCLLGAGLFLWAFSTACEASKESPEEVRKAPADAKLRKRTRGETPPKKGLPGTLFTSELRPSSPHADHARKVNRGACKTLRGALARRSCASSRAVVGPWVLRRC